MFFFVRIVVLLLRLLSPGFFLLRFLLRGFHCGLAWIDFSNGFGFGFLFGWLILRLRLHRLGCALFFILHSCKHACPLCFLCHLR